MQTESRIKLVCFAEVKPVDRILFIKIMNKLTEFLSVAAVAAAVSAGTCYLTGRNQSNQLTINEQNVIPTHYTASRHDAAASFAPVDFTEAAERSVEAVVHVKTKYYQQQYVDPFYQFFFGRPQQSQQPSAMASGSGVILSDDGYIVTNNHVIEGAHDIEVVLNDKRTFPAQLIGRDPNTDLALLKIEAKGLPVISIGNSDDLKVGEWVLAVGNPFNLTSTVTAGIVSAKARSINILQADMKIESFIQTDAAVNPGNSGGALVNTKGELVGINTAIASQTGSYAGYAFAIPTAIMQKVVGDLRQFGSVQRALLGIRMMDINQEVKDHFGLDSMEGVYVAEVVGGTAADKAGMKSGDVIVQVDGRSINSSNQLQEQIGRKNPGDQIVVLVRRGNRSITLEVTLSGM